MRILVLILALLGLNDRIQAKLSNDACNYKEFPIISGGDQDEVNRCIIYDHIANGVVVTGKTNSANYAPAQNDHGFAYLVDFDGNWRWGNFFYNVSYAISDITGCKLTSKGTYIALFGYANSVPIVMTLNREEGSIKNFWSFNLVNTASTTPAYLTYSGFIIEEAEPRDNKEYAYVSFTMNSIFHFIKFASKDSPYTIQYHYTYSSGSSSIYKPRYMFLDNSNN